MFRGVGAALHTRYTARVLRYRSVAAGARHRDGQKGVARQAAEGRVIDTDTADFVRPVEVISNAMELCGFGKNKKRTLYMALCAALLVGAIAGVAAVDSRFYNPFR